MLHTKPTINIVPPAGRSGPPRLYLTIAAVLPDGSEPVSHFRGIDVGVGGSPRHLRDRLGLGDVPVRAATRNEMRRLDRMTVAELRERHPDARIVVSRSRHY